MKLRFAVEFTLLKSAIKSTEAILAAVHISRCRVFSSYRTLYNGKYGSVVALIRVRSGLNLKLRLAIEFT